MPSNGFAVDIAALYTRYNTRLKAPEGRLSSFGRNFIEVPVHFKYKFWLKPVHELAAPFIYAGPSFLFVLTTMAPFLWRQIVSSPDGMWA